MITDRGRELLAGCGPTHIRGIRERFLARLGDEDLAALAGAWRKLLA
jgi:hypothetical protein